MGRAHLASLPQPGGATLCGSCMKDKRWLSVDNDHVIETHYCQPGAKGMNIYPSHMGGGMGLQSRWQFQDVDGSWKNFAKRSGTCSVSSQDIEAQYQQNPNGTMNFTTRSFSYQLDFSALTQRNLSTQTTRSVRRLN